MYSKINILIDSEIFLHLTSDWLQLDDKVVDLLYDRENTLCMSAESVKDVMLLFDQKKITSSLWKSRRDVFKAITEIFHIKIIPVTKEILYTLSILDISEGPELSNATDMLVAATAINKQMLLISRKNKFWDYELVTKYDNVLEFVKNETVSQELERERANLKVTLNDIRRVKARGKEISPIAVTMKEYHGNRVKTLRKLEKEQRDALQALLKNENSNRNNP